MVSCSVFSCCAPAAHYLRTIYGSSLEYVTGRIYVGRLVPPPPPLSLSLSLSHTHTHCIATLAYPVLHLSCPSLALSSTTASPSLTLSFTTVYLHLPCHSLKLHLYLPCPSLKLHFHFVLSFTEASPSLCPIFH